jgi:hypothetical protein
MPALHDVACRRRAAWICGVLFFLSAALAGSCARKERSPGPAPEGSVYGFVLGEAKEAVLKRAAGVARVTRAPDPPLGYRGELLNFSHPLDNSEGIDHVRCAFLDGRLLEVIAYFRDTSRENLETLKLDLEFQYKTQAVAENGKVEMAAKTYRLPGPGMSITLRRITKRNSTELYIQYLHDELHKKLIEMNRTTGEK